MLVPCTYTSAPYVPVGVGEARRVHPLGQRDGAVVAAVQLLHDERQVGLKQRRRRKPPEERGCRHEHGHQQQDVREELQDAGVKGHVMTSGLKVKVLGSEVIGHMTTCSVVVDFSSELFLFALKCLKLCPVEKNQPHV